MKLQLWKKKKELFLDDYQHLPDIFIFQIRRREPETHYQVRTTNALERMWIRSEKRIKLTRKKVAYHGTFNATTLIPAALLWLLTVVHLHF